jgi:aminodeoxychorismate lyase
MIPVDAIPTDDRGFTLGDGLFETLLVDDGPPQFWDEHLERLTAGCAALGLPRPDPLAVKAAADDALVGRSGRLALRITVTAGSGGRGLDRPSAPILRVIATAAPAARPSGPISLVTSNVRRNERSPTSRLKTLAYLDNILARAEVRGLGGDEALMLNTRDEVACAAAANLFWIVDRRLFTPALECGVLDGVMRRRILAAAAGLAIEAVEVRVGLAAVQTADAVFVTNSLIGVGAVASLDGRAMPSHPLVASLAAGV